MSFCGGRGPERRKDKKEEHTLKWWERKKRRGAAPVVQVRQGEGHPFGVLDR